MPLPKPSVPAAPQPTKIFFDPFNSSSTGHQQAENRLSGTTRWRDSRSYKLSQQYGDSTGAGGREHLSDLVGAGSVNFGKDGRKENGDWEAGAPGLREKGWQDIRNLLQGSKKRSSESPQVENFKAKKPKHESVQEQSLIDGMSTLKSNEEEEAEGATIPLIFRGLTMYMNGSTAPLVSDLRLKQLFVQHGGNTSLALGRRTVTHVVLGESCGGGLASGKVQKEVTTVSGKGIRYVTAKWVLDSVERGIRQPEGHYVPPQISSRLGGSCQTTVLAF